MSLQPGAVEQRSYGGASGGERKAAISRMAAGRCPRCGVFVQENYLVCPYCALPLKKECPRCGKQIPPNWNACSYCGHVITSIVPPDPPAEGASAPSAGASAAIEERPRGRCPRCSRLIVDDSRYCGGCGLRIEGIPLGPVDPPEGGRAPLPGAARTDRA